MRGDSIRTILAHGGTIWRCETVLEASGIEAVPVRGGSSDPERVLVRCVSEAGQAEVAVRRGWFGNMSDEELLRAIERALAAQGGRDDNPSSASR